MGAGTCLAWPFEKLQPKRVHARCRSEMKATAPRRRSGFFWRTLLQYRAVTALRRGNRCSGDRKARVFVRGQRSPR